MVLDICRSINVIGSPRAINACIFLSIDDNEEEGSNCVVSPCLPALFARHNERIRRTRARLKIIPIAFPQSPERIPNDRAFYFSANLQDTFEMTVGPFLKVLFKTRELDANVDADPTLRRHYRISPAILLKVERQFLKCAIATAMRTVSARSRWLDRCVDCYRISRSDRSPFRETRELSRYFSKDSAERSRTGNSRSRCAAIWLSRPGEHEFLRNSETLRITTAGRIQAIHPSPSLFFSSPLFSPS